MFFTLLFWLISIWLLIGLIKTILITLIFIFCMIKDPSLSKITWEEIKDCLFLMLINIISGPLPMLPAII
jgi:hypothetical protein